MKKAFQLAVPVLLIAAMFAVYYLSPEAQLPFSDIAGHEAVEDIVFWSERGVLNGTNGKFRPDGSITKAELATVLTRVFPLEAVAENTFADVEAGEWYEEAILQCVAAGIIHGESGSALFPKAELTREEGFVMIARAFGIAPSEELRLLAGYNDTKLMNPAYRGYMEALLSLELVVGGSEVQFYPREPFTRGELTMALTKLLDGGYIV